MSYRNGVERPRAVVDVVLDRLLLVAFAAVIVATLVGWSLVLFWLTGSYGPSVLVLAGLVLGWSLARIGDEDR